MDGTLDIHGNGSGRLGHAIACYLIHSYMAEREREIVFLHTVRVHATVQVGYIVQYRYN